MVAKSLQQEILNLNAKDKIKLVELIMESLNNTDVNIQHIWVEESEKRYNAYKSGKIKHISYQEVMKRLER